MERSREKLKDLLKGAAWGPDLVDTIFAISDRVGRSTKAVASGATEAVTTVVQVAAAIHWSRIIGKPATFPPSMHTHSQYLTEELDPVFASSPAGGITQDHVDAMNEMLLDRRAWGGEWGYIWERP